MRPSFWPPTISRGFCTKPTRLKADPLSQFRLRSGASPLTGSYSWWQSDLQRRNMLDSKQIMLPTGVTPTSEALDIQGFLVCGDDPDMVSEELIQAFLDRGHIAIVPPSLRGRFLADHY